MNQYDVIIIGAGISGLTAASLIANRQRKVALVEASTKPGGSCGIFKRNGVIFEQGAAMFYGFGEKGFNPHRYVFNALKAPITMIHHKELYAIEFEDKRIVFPEDVDEFVKELGSVFPEEKEGIRAFYHDMQRLYEDVIMSTPVFQSPDVIPKEQGAKQFKQHPFSYIKFLSYMNISVETLLKKYMKGEEILNFFNKLTSTYCYANVKEAPAVLGAVMFIDNHTGGSYYPVGSSMMLTGILEKVFEEQMGDCFYSTIVEQLLITDNHVNGVKLSDGRELYAKQVIYSGNVWSLYEKLLHKPMKHVYEPTYNSIIYYALVNRQVIPESAYPIEMLIDQGGKFCESEVTVYILSKDDTSLCAKNQHVIVVIGPSFSEWTFDKNSFYHSKEYKDKKAKEKKRMIDLLERRFPRFREHILYDELATPYTLERYVLKYHGAVAGPKQMLGQHMLKRQHTKTQVEGLYCCGEGTVMGTGTPAVTVSGIAAANVALREEGLKEYTTEEGEKNFVQIVDPPYDISKVSISTDQKVNTLATLARKCQYCEHPSCKKACPLHIPICDINRRLSVGNIVGAKKQLQQVRKQDAPVVLACSMCKEVACEKHCICKSSNDSVSIRDIMMRLSNI